VTRYKGVMNAITQLRFLRVANGFTQYDLGRLVGRNQNWVSGAERGLIALSPTDIDRLAVALGVAPTLLRPLEPPMIGNPKGGRRARANA
jgi:transcriptional regulator with XRE-family HTH domain